MDKQLRIWITVLEKTKEDIMARENYNGLVIDDLETLIADMKRAKKEATSHIRPCDRCDNKFIQDLTCKQCAYMEHPEDTTI